MLSCNKTPAIILLVSLLAFSSCMEQKILFKFNRDVDKTFFRKIPGIGDSTFMDSFKVSKMATELQICRASFKEKYIEKDNLLEFTELNDSSENNNVRYLNVTRYSQDLYLIKYEFIYSITEDAVTHNIPVAAAIYFSVKHNGKGETIGITPCYFGIINVRQNLIAFNTDLSVKEDKDHHFYLDLHPPGKNKRGLVFMPANFPAMPVALKSTFNIEKIVRLDANKVGGTKPLVFNINDIFKDSNALQFHYFKSLHF